MTDTAASSPWLTAGEAGDYIRSAPKLVYREVHAGRLRAARVGGRRELRFRREWLDEFLERTAEPVVINA